MRQPQSHITKSNHLKSSRGTILVLSESKEITEDVIDSLKNEGYDICAPDNIGQAQTDSLTDDIKFILIDVNHAMIHGDEYIASVKAVISNHNIPLMILASENDDALLESCIAAGCDDFIFKPYIKKTLKYRIASMEKLLENKNLYNNSIKEQVVAKRVLANALSVRSLKLEEVELLSKSAAVFSGDLFLTARRPDGGINVLLADFTGHGLSAAIGVLPVADIFNEMTIKGFSVENILESINIKLYNMLPTSMFMACCLAYIESDLKQVKVWNGGIPDVYVLDEKTSKIKHKVKSENVALGIDALLINQVKLQTIDINKNDKLIMYTDGLTDAEDTRGDMFGQERLDCCIEDQFSKLSTFDNIVSSFNQFRGEVHPFDDVTLACITCKSTLIEVHVDKRVGVV